MELKLDIYTDRCCRKVEKTVVAEAFELSTGICEDVLNAFNIDMFEGGLDALSDEAKQSLGIDIVKNGYPVFIGLIKEIFGLTDDEAKRIKLADVTKVIMMIVKYAFGQLTSALGSKEKN